MPLTVITITIIIAIQNRWLMLLCLLLLVLMITIVLAIQNRFPSKEVLLKQPPREDQSLPMTLYATPEKGGRLRARASAGWFKVWSLGSGFGVELSACRGGSGEDIRVWGSGFRLGTSVSISRFRNLAFNATAWGRSFTYLWLAGNEGIERENKTTTMGYIGIPRRIQSFIPSQPKVTLGIQVYK